MSVTAGLSSLRVVRQPGPSGPILSCTGALTGSTAAALLRELELLAALEHVALTADLSACRFGDVEGMLELLEVLQRLGEERCRLVIVGGTEQMARLLRAAGIDQLLPVFATTEEAESALRLGVPPPVVPATWEESREAMVSYWKEIRELVEYAPRQEVLRELTLMTALCERAEQLFRQQPRPAAWRCQYCPLFYALGGRPEDVGCRSLQDPILRAVRAGDRPAARALVARAGRLVEEMPLPEETPDPTAPA